MIIPVTSSLYGPCMWLPLPYPHHIQLVPALPCQTLFLCHGITKIETEADAAAQAQMTSRLCSRRARRRRAQGQDTARARRAGVDTSAPRGRAEGVKSVCECARAVAALVCRLSRRSVGLSRRAGMQRLFYDLWGFWYARRAIIAMCGYMCRLDWEATGRPGRHSAVYAWHNGTYSGSCRLWLSS